MRIALAILRTNEYFVDQNFFNMKNAILTAWLFSMAAIGCTGNKSNDATTSSSADTSTTRATTDTSANADAAPAVVDSATMMKNWMAYSTPGEMHKMVAGWDGTWNGEVTMWHAAGAPPEISKSRAVNKTVMGGRYQVSNHTGNMMGMPFEGMSTLAYDNFKKVFISTWIDNVGTGLMKLEGPWDAASKSMTLTGKCVDPSSGTGKEMAIREVFHIVDDKTHVMEMFGPGTDGKEFKMMEIKMTKQ